MTVTPYIAFARIAFLKILAYRLRYYTGIVMVVDFPAPLAPM